VTIVDDIATAIEDHQIVAYYQPQVDVPSRRIVAAEALARWVHPVHGVLPPEVFIPAAQHHGLIDDLGILMAEEAARSAVAWSEAGHPIQVSVNVSATQLTKPRLTDWLHFLLQKSSLPAESLIIEITETNQFDDLPDVAGRLTELRALGLGISIDDFGAGFSSFARIESLPATELKIDLSLVQDETDEGYAALIEIVEYAHQRGIRVVAEGVETTAQARRVEALRCHRAQGFLYGAAVTEPEFSAALMSSGAQAAGTQTSGS
jgi:EAL domain-containing protein (putative c-di-GMP-specific phosphodiesterase class I)